MSFVAVVSVVASSVEAVMAVLAFVFSRAPGWRHLRVFAVVAITAAAYSAVNVVFTSEGAASATLLTAALGINYLAACLHCAAWLVYCRVQYGDDLRSFERTAVVVLLTLGVLGFVPGILASGAIEAQHVGWAGVTYTVPSLTLLGALLLPLPPIVLLVPLRRYFVKTRERVPGASWHFLAFCVFFLLALNEALASVGAFENIYLADVGFLVAVLSVVAEMATRVVTDANRLLDMSRDLSRQVEERTQELLEAREGLLRAERLSALGRLSASVGHEINNPLSYVVGNLEYALRELERPGTPRLVLEALRDAHGGAERIRRIVRELRIFGRGAPEHHRELTDPVEALRSALRLTGNEIRCRARLVQDLEPVPTVLADPTQLTQVFVNLLLNAAQAIPETLGADQGVITVRSRTLSDGRIGIEVSDTGTGISERDQRRLFEPFFTTKPQDQGTGLGLFVSLGIVTSFGGNIDVESKLGVGTTVRVLLPPPPPGARFKQGSVSTPPPPSRDKRLLVVDDDVLVARTLVRLLKGHHVEIVTSGHAALERLRKDGASFDLVLCDLMMPGMTGMELFEEIERCQPSLADRFVFISGGGVTDRSHQFIENHRERVLSKPLDCRAISRVLAHRVHGPRAAVTES